MSTASVAHRPAFDQLPDPSSAIRDRRVGEIMSTRLLTVNEQESVLIAWELLRRSGSRHLPVVSEDGRCLGVLDIVTVASEYAHIGLSLSPTPVGKLLLWRRRPRVSSHDPVHRAARIMTEGKTDALPVVDAHGRIVGLVTATDLVALLVAAPGGSQPAVAEKQIRPSMAGSPTLSDYLPADYSATA